MRESVVVLFTDLVGSTELVLALIDAEATEAIGAEGYQRSETCSNWRNGGRERLLATKAGYVELKSPS